MEHPKLPTILGELPSPTGLGCGDLPPAFGAGEIRAFKRLLDEAILKKAARDPKFAAFWARETKADHDSHGPWWGRKR